MKSASGLLIALLATRQFVSANLYMFTDIDDNVYRWTSADRDVITGGNTWSSRGPLLDTAQQTAHWKAGLDVDVWDLMVAPRPFDPVTGSAFPDQLLGKPWVEAARAGALDGSEVLIERAYLPEWPQPYTPSVVPTGKLILFGGRAAEIEPTRSGVLIHVRSHLELLNTNVPRNAFQAGCRFTLFGPGCSLDAADFVTSAVVGSGPTQTIIPATIAEAAGYFDLGRLVVTSGANNGFRRSIRKWDGTALTLISPLPYTVAPGDHFDVYPGCDKTKTTCTDKFSNLVNFGGFPDIPAPETAI